MSETQLILTRIEQILEGISTLNARLTRIENHLQIRPSDLEEEVEEEESEDEGLNSGEAISVMLALM